LDARAQYKDQAQIADLLSTNSLIFNMDQSKTKGSTGFAINSELWSSVFVRQALSLAIDRNAIAEKLTFARPATGFISYGVYNGSDADTAFRDAGGKLLDISANLDLARSYLSLAGINPSDYKITITYRDTVDDIATYEIVRAAWQSLGFQVAGRRVLNASITYNIDDGAVNTDVLQDDYSTNNFDVILLDYQMLSTDAFAALASFSTTMNGNGIDIKLDESNGTTKYTTNTAYGGFSNSDYDALIMAAYEQKNTDRRATLLHNAESALLALMPIVPLVFNQNYYIINKDLKKIEFSPYGFTVWTDAKLKNYEKYLPADGN
jgi:ABC-type transport system substrate-binding protein